MERRRNAVYLIIILALLAGLGTGRSFFFTVAYAFAGLMLLAGLWAWTGQRRLTIERQLHARRAQVGRYLEERFIVYNSSRIPKLWLEFYDESDLPGHQASTVLGGIGSKGRSGWTVRTLCAQRGEYRLGPLHLVSSDPFGLFELRRQLAPASTVIVYPPIVPLVDFPLPLGVLSGGDALRRRSAQVTANASTVRDYAPGDSFGRIHWRSTARRDRLMVKEFELDPLSDLWLVLDAEQEVHPGRYRYRPGDYQLMSEARRNQAWIPPTTEEYSVAVAASLAVHFLGAERAVGLIAHGQRRECIQVDRGPRQVTKILESLAVLSATGTRPFDQLLSLEADQFNRGATLVLITPSTRPEWLAMVYNFARRGLRMAVVLIDGHSFGGPPGVEAQVAQLALLRIPALIVRQGDDLSLALSSERSRV